MLEVRRLRQARGWNQTELAYHAGLAPSVISQIENGKRSPTARTLEKLATALKVEVGDLFPKASPRLPLDLEEQAGQAAAYQVINARSGDELYRFAMQEDVPPLEPGEAYDYAQYLERVNRQLTRFLSGEDPKLVVAGLGYAALQQAKRTAPQSEEALQLGVLWLKAMAEADPHSRYWPLERKRLAEGLEQITEGARTDEEARK